jgi:deoxyribodipyrimidine photo-lyase
MKPVIVWFRRDLRIDDNPALHEACLSGAPVIPLFVFDEDIIAEIPSDGAVFDFQAQALSDLSADLAGYGGRLITRRGRILEVHRQMIAGCNPVAIYFNRDYEPRALQRDEAITRLYASHGVTVRTFKDIVVHEPEEVLTADGNPYVVFTPYSRTWKRLSHPAPTGNPHRFTTPSMPSDGVFDAAALQKTRNIPQPAFKGGSSAALKQWRWFMGGAITSYDQHRNFPAEQGSSRMSPYLRFGCISIRRMLADCERAARSAGTKERQSIEKYVDELIWREFYQAVLFHFPHLISSNYRPEFDLLPWEFSETLFEKWKMGRTGFPLVDAGMRELNETGWMHNRVRMVVASFLTKDLMHDWRLGQGVFEEKLLDIETASNNGGWQWAASTGVDPRPLRIFNPTLQAERFDPGGAYIRRFVPELADVPDKYIHAPHVMPESLQRQIGCVIGSDYPRPVVDHRHASAHYKAVFASVRSQAKGHTI